MGEPLSLLRASVLVFCSARPARKRGMSAVDPNLLDLTPLLPSSANLNLPNASRLICDVASGALPADESDEVILAPFAGTSLADADVASHSFDYLVAVENGKNFGSVEKCELRYSCPVSAGQLRQIFNEA